MIKDFMNNKQHRTEQQWRLYCELELIEWDQSGLDFSKPMLQTAFAEAWHHLKGFLKPIDEPQIQEVTDRNGKTQWRVYDPVNDRVVRLNSPQEVATWLENLALRRLHCSSF